MPPTTKRHSFQPLSNLFPLYFSLCHAFFLLLYLDQCPCSTEVRASLLLFFVCSLWRGRYVPCLQNIVMTTICSSSLEESNLDRQGWTSTHMRTNTHTHIQTLKGQQMCTDTEILLKENGFRHPTLST